MGAAWSGRSQQGGRYPGKSPTFTKRPMGTRLTAVLSH